MNNKLSSNDFAALVKVLGVEKALAVMEESKPKKSAAKEKDVIQFPSWDAMVNQVRRDFDALLSPETKTAIAELREAYQIIAARGYAFEKFAYGRKAFADAILTDERRQEEILPVEKAALVVSINDKGESVVEVDKHPRNKRKSQPTENPPAILEKPASEGMVTRKEFEELQAGINKSMSDILAALQPVKA